mgnify:CR=1 FL=1
MAIPMGEYSQGTQLWPAGPSHPVLEARLGWGPGPWGGWEYGLAASSHNPHPGGCTYQPGLCQGLLPEALGGADVGTGPGATSLTSPWPQSRAELAWTPEGGPGWGGVSRVGDFDFLNICSGTSESPALAQCLLWSEDTSSFHVNYQERELVTYCGLTDTGGSWSRCTRTYYFLQLYVSLDV